MLLSVSAGLQGEGEAKGRHTKIVCGDCNAILELDCYHRSAGDNGRLRMLVWHRGLHVRMIIWAVNVISGLQSRLEATPRTDLKSLLSPNPGVSGSCSGFIRSDKEISGNFDEEFVRR